MNPGSNPGDDRGSQPLGVSPAASSLPGGGRWRLGQASRRIGGLLSDWLPAVTMMALIFWLSSQSYLPGPDDRLLDYLLKKSGHVVAYAALAVCGLRAVHLARRPFAVAFLLVLLYAASDEIHQASVPLRGPSLVDVAIDAAAAAVALRVTRRILEGERGRLRTAARRAIGLGG